uniref:Uncharacterized protein n=1 Tax=Anopheles farauti TaxID=69004 RepID=A0A499FUT7_9DIPT
MTQAIQVYLKHPTIADSFTANEPYVVHLSSAIALPGGWIVLAILLLDGILSASAERYFVVPYLKDGKWEDNPKYISTNVTIRNLPTETKPNISFYFPKVVQDIWSSIAVLLDMGGGELKAPLSNKSFALCPFLANPASHRWAYIIYQQLKRCGPITKCPIPVGPLVFRGVSLSAIRLPPFFPETNVVAVIKTKVGKESMHDSRWYGGLRRVTCKPSRRC